MKIVERAAGGFVVRKGASGLEVLMIDDAYGHVTFPKGHVEKGETWEDAAIREIREETGIEARILAPLGRVEYPVPRDGKTVSKQVRFFLLEEIDEADNPVAQESEVRAAYFVPWHEASRLHDEKGYTNWSWVFAKAEVLWQWYENRYKDVWRDVSASSPEDELDRGWQAVRPLVDELYGAIRKELQTVASDIYGLLTERLGTDIDHHYLPKAITDKRQQLKDAIEHTLLKPEASVLGIERICHEALAHEFRAVCINPQHVERAAECLAGSSVIPCTVIGFPLGAAHRGALVAEARAVVEAGARDVDMVLPIGSMLEDDIWTVFDYVKAVCDEVHRTDSAKVKVIFENHFLAYSQVAMASYICAAAGADFIKTSTGFAPSGAKLADVALMAYGTQGKLGVKAAGGIRTQTDAVAFLRYGADRLGTSSGVQIVR